MKEATEDKLSVQMEAISNVFESFKDIDPLRQISKELLQEQYVMLAQWATCYFDVVGVDSMDLWAILCKVQPSMFYMSISVSLLWTSGTVTNHGGKSKKDENSIHQEKAHQRGQEREEFIRDWLKDVGAEDEEEESKSDGE
ncbi:Hypothetical predicted protein, partial [Paramuricea clavata]